MSYFQSAAAIAAVTQVFKQRTLKSVIRATGVGKDSTIERIAALIVEAVNALRRSTTDRWIGGVCGGLARATGVESWIWRLIFAVLLLFGGTGLLIYLLLWIFVPVEQTNP